MRTLILNTVVLLAGASCLRAAEPTSHAEEIETAVNKSVALIEKSGATYRQERQCFSCHHQALPVLALAEVRRRGFEIDEDEFREQLSHTWKHLKRGQKSYQAGKGQGGRVDTAGYALWTLQAGDWEADEITGAVASYLVKKDADRPHWSPTSTRRPPTSGSQFTSTTLAIYGLQSFGDDGNSDAIESRLTKAGEWLRTREVDSTEDRVFRLQALQLLEADEDELSDFAQELIAQQRDDGGWAQLTDRDSDAYATGTVLVALQQAGSLAVTDSVYQRGVRYLLETQKDDGSWHVVSRAKPFQQYFESGFPHGKDQFISMAATCWSTMALASTREVVASSNQ